MAGACAHIAVCCVYAANHTPTAPGPLAARTGMWTHTTHFRGSHCLSCLSSSLSFFRCRCCRKAHLPCASRVNTSRANASQRDEDRHCWWASRPKRAWRQITCPSSTAKVIIRENPKDFRRPSFDQKTFFLSAQRTVRTEAARLCSVVTDHRNSSRSRARRSSTSSLPTQAPSSSTPIA